MSTNIDSLSIKITADTSSAKKGIDKLSSSLEKLSKVSQSAGFSAISKSIRTLAEDADKLRGVGETFSLFSDALRSFSRIKPNNIDSLGWALSRIGTAANLLDENAVSKVERLSAALVSLRAAGGAISKASAVLDKMRAAGGSPDPTLTGKTEIAPTDTQVPDPGAKASADAQAEAAKRAAEAFAKLKAAASSAASSIKKAASALGKFASITLWPLTKAVSSIGKGFKNATKKAGEAFAALKRIAVYRLLRTAIKAITQSLKEGIENLYQYSTIFGTQFQKSMDMLATSALYLKNSLAAMVSPIINAVAPAIDVLVDKFVELINYVNQFISSLTGKETWTAAKKIPTVFKEAEDGAKNTAKAIKSWTVGIDELNIIEDTGKGGSGAAGNALDYSQMFEERTVEKPISDFAAQLKEQFENGDWAALGTTIGTALNTAVTKINWTNIGSTIGTKLDGVIKTLNQTEKTFDFTGLGSKVGAGLTAAVQAIDWTNLGSLMMGLFTGAVDAISGFASGVDWAKIGKAIGDFVKGFFERFTSWITGKNKKKGFFIEYTTSGNGWADMGKSLVETLVAFFGSDGLNFDEVADAFFEALGAAFGAAVAGMAGVFQGIGEQLQNIANKYLLDPITGEKKTGLALMEGYVELFANGFGEVINAVQDKAGAFAKGFAEGYGADYEKDFGTTQQITDRIKEQAAAGPNAVGYAGFLGLPTNNSKAALIKSLSSDMEEIADAAENPNGNSLKTRFQNFGSTILQKLGVGATSQKATTGGVLGNISSWLGSKFYTPEKTSIYDRFKNMGINILAGFQTGTTNKKSTVGTSLSTTANALMEKFNGTGDNTLTKRTGRIGSNMLTGFQGKLLAEKPNTLSVMKNLANDSVTNFNKPNGDKTLTERLKTIATNAVGGAASGANSKKSGLFTAMTDIGNDSVKSFNMAGGEKSLTDRMKIIATNAVGGAAVGSLSKQATLNTNAKTLGNGLVTAFNMAGGEKSLTERMKAIGTNASGGAKSGLAGGESTLLAKAKAIGESVSTTFDKPDGTTSLKDRLKSTGGDGASGFTSGFSFSESQKWSIENVGSTAYTLFRNNTTNGKTDSNNKFYGIGEDSATGYKNGVDDASKADWFKNAIAAWAQRAIDAFTGKLKTGSPSRVFKEIGEFSVEGYNIGIAEEGKTTAGVVQQWADSFTSIPAAFAIDTSAVDTYDPGRYLQSVQTEVASHSSLSVEGVAEGMEVFFSRMLQPMLQQIADDTRRQADKNEQTVVELDGRVLTKTIEKQQRANGYRFAMA